ncbi:MAG: sugar transporter permease, partial [Clostridia bacterium]|nr:sugar transporter permease [Clostridia bacterium]
MVDKKSERLLGIIIVLYLCIIVFPFIWVGLTSIKPESEIWSSSALQVFSGHPTLEHYQALFK